MNRETPQKTNKKEMVYFLSMTILLTFSFTLISAVIGHFTLSSLRFFGFVLLLLVFLALFPFSAVNRSLVSRIRENAEDRKKALSLVLMVAAFVVLVSTSSRVYWMLSVGIFVIGITSISDSRLEQYSLPVVAGTLMFIVVFLVHQYNPYVLRGISSLSLQFSGFMGTLCGIHMRLGTDASGFWVWLYFLLCGTGLFAFNARGEPRRVLFFVYFAVGSVLLWMLSLLLYGLVFSSLDLYPLTQVTLLQLSLFFLLVGLFFYSIWRIPQVEAYRTVNPQNIRRAAVLLVLLVSVVFLTVLPFVTQGGPGKVVFYQRDCAMDSYIPEFPEEGESLVGDMGITLGATLWYFEERGYTMEILTDETSASLKDALQDADVVMVANLTSPLSAEDIEAVNAFVKRGGGLLVFGEHTNMMASLVDFQSGRHYLNDILSMTGIRIQMDTAEWMQHHWQTSTELLPHAVTWGLTSEDVRTGSVGASLTVSGTAEPVMVGRYAFSDNPDPLEAGFLGNREFESGEQLGDIILAAADTYGKGKVLVFGDTSYSFNEALPSTWRLMENSVDFLTDTYTIPYSLTWVASAVFLICAGSVLYFERRRLLESHIFVVLLAALIISGFVSSLIDTPHPESDVLAWIDAAHCNLLNTRGYKDNSVDGLTKNFLRNDYIPLYLQDTSQLKEGRILVIIAPTRGYSSGEVNDIISFVEQGGLLILSAGAAERDALRPLLQRVEMDIGNVPLGPVPWIIETHGRTPEISQENLDKYWHEPKFMEAYPVGGTNLSKSYATLTYLGQTYDLIISKQYGKGIIVLIGDSRFLLNENLEYSLEPSRLGLPTFAAIWVGNVELLRDIITDFQEAQS
ncbi:MAG: hypothetical protein HXS41_09055 [Theionarchaea archaeon]|nr:hypothetical protein [Theionarchaea archaeon]MBU7021194.1 hypothetical protein [Theionarchaea archaeon]